MKDHSDGAASKPNSIRDQTIALMLERQATTDAMVMALCRVLKGIFAVVAELNEDRSRSRSQSRRRSASAGRRRSTTSATPQRQVDVEEEEEEEEDEEDEDDNDYVVDGATEKFLRRFMP